MVFWRVTPCSLVDASISGESAASVFSATLNSVSVLLLCSINSKPPNYVAFHRRGPQVWYWPSWAPQVSHVQALKIHLFQWTSYLKDAGLNLTSDTCWHCHWGTCMGVSFETHVQPYCKAPPPPFPHTASSSVKFLLQISNILIGWDVFIKEGFFISNNCKACHNSSSSVW